MRTDPARPDATPGPPVPPGRSRPGRLRATAALRRLVAETRLAPADLVAPLFVKEGVDEPEPVASMPGVHRHTVASLLDEAARLRRLGVGAVLLFGVPARKDPDGSGAWDDDGVVQQALRALRDAHGDDLVLVADTCLCEYTDHGHCGPVGRDGVVANDAAVDGYVRAAVSQAAAGADLVAPSGMMDGQVAAIRDGLDRAGHAEDVGVLAYAVKTASAFYGPFRDAAESAPSHGDRRSHQLDPANGDEAVREARADAAEGADALIVKPAMPCLDLVRRAKEATGLPLAAFEVSGEHAMLAAAGRAGWLDDRAAGLEAALACRRAGADLVITYRAADLAADLGG